MSRPAPKLKLNLERLTSEAARFAERESGHFEPSLYGVTDGKAIGTYLEQKFRNYLTRVYSFDEGNSARGIDSPSLGVDMKVTSVTQPQSSCPFKSGRQKVFGLGYSLLVFAYEKSDHARKRAGLLQIRHVLFVEAHRTGDYQTTRGLLEILEREGTQDELVAFMTDRMLPVDEIEAIKIAEDLLGGAKLEQGYLTISNALQWRLQYSRAISQAGQVDGVRRVR